MPHSNSDHPDVYHHRHFDDAKIKLLARTVGELPAQCSYRNPKEVLKKNASDLTLLDIKVGDPSTYNESQKWERVGGWEGPPTLMLH